MTDFTDKTTSQYFLMTEFTDKTTSQYFLMTEFTDKTTSHYVLNKQIISGTATRSEHMKKKQQQKTTKKTTREREREREREKRERERDFYKWQIMVSYLILLAISFNQCGHIVWVTLKRQQCRIGHTRRREPQSHSNHSLILTSLILTTVSFLTSLILTTVSF